MCWLPRRSRPFLYPTPQRKAVSNQNSYSTKQDEQHEGPCLPCCWSRYKQQGLFAPRTLLRFLTTTDTAESLSPSTDFPVSPVIRLPCSADFATGRGGFLQLLSMTLSPCCPYQPRRSVVPHQSMRRSMLPSPKNGRLGLRTCPFEAIWVHLRYGPVTRSPSLKMASSIGFRIFSFHPSCYSSYGAWTLTPVGLAPTVHASLRWTHRFRGLIFGARSGLSRAAACPVRRT
jgi:hypothetical protein